MIGRGLTAMKMGFSVAMNALGLVALLGAAWLMPYVLDQMVRISGMH